MQKRTRSSLSHADGKRVSKNRRQQSARRLVAITPERRVLDQEHGFKRGWGVLGSLTGSKKISMAHGILPPGIKAKAHEHPYETAIYILAGSVRVFWGSGLTNTTDLQAGDFLFIPANVPHGPQNLGDVQMEYIVARNTPEEKAESLE